MYFDHDVHLYVLFLQYSNLIHYFWRALRNHSEDGGGYFSGMTNFRIRSCSSWNSKTIVQRIWYYISFRILSNINYDIQDTNYVSTIVIRCKDTYQTFSTMCFTSRSIVHHIMAGWFGVTHGDSKWGKFIYDQTYRGDSFSFHWWLVTPIETAWFSALTTRWHPSWDDDLHLRKWDKWQEIACVLPYLLQMFGFYGLGFLGCWKSWDANMIRMHLDSVKSLPVFLCQGCMNSMNDVVTYYMGVSKNRGTPKWMVYNGKPY